MTKERFKIFRTQRASNLSHWEKLSQEGSLSVAYPISSYLFMYEPVCVSRANVPEFDERFVGYGMTRDQCYKTFLPVIYELL
jgi:hypothetical protein